VDLGDAYVAPGCTHVGQGFSPAVNVHAVRRPLFARTSLFKAVREILRRRAGLQPCKGQ
jgi:hypothetical protein